MTPDPKKPARPRGKPTPPWFGLARRYARHMTDHSMQAIRESIARGWAREVGEKEVRLLKGRKDAVSHSTRRRIVAPGRAAD